MRHVTRPTLGRHTLGMTAAALLFCGSVVRAVADPVADANAALARGDYAAALPLLTDLAGHGLAAAQHDLCTFSFTGLGVPQDYQAAMSWCLKAAQQELPRSQAMLATIYEHGLGTAQDYAAALTWYRRAADHGFAPAQSGLAAMYEHGEGVAIDIAAAAAWYRKAADQGFPPAQSNLGTMYQQGRGVPQDHAMAATWYRKAADQGFPFAQNNLGMLYLHGDGVAQDLVEAYVWLTLASRAPASLAGLRDTAIEGRSRAAAQLTPTQIAGAQTRLDGWRPVVASPWSTLQLTSAPETTPPGPAHSAPLPVPPQAGSPVVPRRVTTTRIMPDPNAPAQSPSIDLPRPVTTTRIAPGTTPLSAPLLPAR